VPEPGERVNSHALAVLELPAVLELVASRASSSPGAERVRALSPTTDTAWIRDEHERVEAARELAFGDVGWRPEPIPDLHSPLARLRLGGATWTAAELVDGALLLRSSRLTRHLLEREVSEDGPAAPLLPFAARLLEARRVEEGIDHAIDPDGSVRDEASPVLRRLRRELRGAEADLVRLLERVMARLEPHQRVADMSVTVRNGRYVIPIRREARGAVGGIVQDQSATRGTLFVEPPAAIEAGNRIRELEADERQEVERILSELTEQLRPLREAMLDALEVLATLDSLYARARFARDFHCAPTRLAAAGSGFEIRGGRHPLLVARGGDVVPFDLGMEPHERTLLLSGPNTGGKTVLLKALGLVSALAQCGIPAPVDIGSRVPVYDGFFADIGDEQSIEASLSTFSAHVRNLADILHGATGDSLVLIDELGSGTDPAEGAALASAILEELTRRGACTVATTHLGALKLLATELPGFVNASLQFDEEALAPTYRLIKGIPGRSYGLAIARRLQLPENVLARAAERFTSGERDVAELLSQLQRREVELREREADAASAAARADVLARELDERERELKAAERSAESRARQEARRHLMEARSEVERAIRDLRESADVDAAAREARRRIEESAAAQAAELERLSREADGAAREAPSAGRSRTPRREHGAIAVDDTVEVATLGGRPGRVLELRGRDALVSVGAMKLTVPVSTLSHTSAAAVAAAPAQAVPIRGAVPEEDARGEIDLRGLRVDEMELELLHAIDGAVRGDLRTVRIIHGKGTGALRERVAELLRGDPRVREFRLGTWNEGGAGVTVAELR